MRSFSLFILVFLVGLSSCIQDDILNDTVDPVLRITNKVDTIAIDDSFQFEAMFLNNVGLEESVTVEWTSNQPDIISIESFGLAQGITAGSSLISAAYESGSIFVRDSVLVSVGDVTVSSDTERSGTIRTTSSYTLTGSFQIRMEEDELILDIADDYRASSNLPGLYLYLTNNPNSTANALEVGPVDVFSGAHSYVISGATLSQFSHLLYFCKPFNVKVGDGEIL